MTDNLTLRNAHCDDVPALLEIYNHYVRETAVSFDIEPVSLAVRRDWFKQFSEDGPHQLVVAAREGVLVGYASSAIFRLKPAYARSVEKTIYLAPGEIGHGTGAALYEHLFARITPAGLHRAYGVITLPNYASIGLHEKLGFVGIGILSEVGIKFGKYWDTYWMERQF